MSKMIKDSDVEDILFSIRRLVSDAPIEKPALSQSEEIVVDPVIHVEALNADALFLTSSLRVNDPETEPEQIDLEDMTVGLPHFRDAVTRSGSEEAKLLSLDEVFAVKPDGPRRLHLSDVVTDVAQKVDGDYFEDEDTGRLSGRKWAVDPDTDTLHEFATQDEACGLSDTKDASVVETRSIHNDLGKDRVVEDQAEVAEEELEAGATDGLADFDENIFDEEALRDMVTEIVREELSGDLGERITRNVRKLVRREIHRALTAREFD